MIKTIYIVAMFILFVSASLGQRLVPVPSDVIDGLATTIKNDSVARRAALPTQTIYTLKRNGYYPVVSTITNYDYFLHIKAEPGTGYKPLLVPWPVSGTTYTYNINFRNHGKLEGLTLEASRPTGGVNNRYLNVYNNAKLYVKDCEVMHDRGSAFALLGDSCSIFIEDSFVHSCGHPKVLGGNGRLVDVRATSFVDSIVVKNTTFFNLTDRIVRNMGTRIDHLVFDHNTGLSTEGFHGGLQAGKTRELTVTNNIFYNMIGLGSFKKRTSVGTTAHEQTQPEKWLMHVLTLDTVYADSKIVVRNNNVFWDQSYKNLWAKYKDSTDVPGIITPTIMKQLKADSVKAYFTDPLVFQAPPPSIIAFCDSGLLAPNATTLPENWWFTYQDSSGKSPINASYPTTAKSYTAGDGGLPVGDLNWFPTKKAQWLATAVENESPVTIPSEFSLHQNYPNPFNPSTKITFTLPKNGKITLQVFNTLGQVVATLADHDYVAGTHELSFDASALSSGVYFYTLKSKDFSVTKKMMLVK